MNEQMIPRTADEAARQEYPDIEPRDTHPTISSALRSAADDWEAAGSGGLDPARRLRAAATAYTRSGR